MSEFEPSDERRVDILIMDLGEKAISGIGDLIRLAEESETIREDYPEYNIIIWKL